MSAPVPVIVLLSVLVAWPALKLAVALLTRPSWRRIKTLRDELLADSRTTEAEARVIRGVFHEAFGGPMELLAPALIAIALPVVAWRGLCGKEELHGAALRLRKLTIEQFALIYDVSVDLFIFSDKRFDRLVDRSTELAFSRYPVSTFLMFIVVMINLPFLLFSFGIHISLRKLVRDIANSSRFSSLMLVSAMTLQRHRGLHGPA